MTGDRQRPAFRRLFVALPLDDATRAAVAGFADRLRAAGLRGRFVRPENYHVTLAFLGNVPLEALPILAEALERTARSSASLAIPLERTGGFPNERHARTVWLGPRCAVPRFAALHGALLANLAAGGFNVDAKPQAHVTLCRCDGAALPSVAPPGKLAVAADALVLYSSLTLSEGARYTAEHRAAFA